MKIRIIWLFYWNTK